MSLFPFSSGHFPSRRFFPSSISSAKIVFRCLDVITQPLNRKFCLWRRAPVFSPAMLGAADPVPGNFPNKAFLLRFISTFFPKDAVPVYVFNSVSFLSQVRIENFTKKKNIGPNYSANMAFAGKKDVPDNAKLASLEQFRLHIKDGDELTTNQGVKISDNQNSLRPGPRWVGRFFSSGLTFSFD